jgi:hypothetical protein
VLALLPLVAGQVSIVRGNRNTTVLDVPPATGALLIATVVFLALHRWSPGLVMPLETRARVVVTRAASVVGVVALLVVAAPTLYLPGAIGRVLQRLAHPRRPSLDGRTGWVTRSSGLRELRRDARRPFVTTEPADRRRRVLVGLAVVVVLATTSSVVVAAGRDRTDDAGGPLVLSNWREVRYSELPAFADVPWADDLQDELHNVEIPGRYVKVVDGVRRSLSMPSCACPRVKVWLFGGSAAFGVGQRDEGTIASYLVRHAASERFALDIENLGANGFTVWDDFQKFASRLALTDDRPDLVIFYDGFNDVVGTVLHVALHGLDPAAPTVLDADESIEYNKGPPSLETYGGPAAVGRFAVEKYAGIKRQIDAVALSAGLPTMYFFQSDAFASRDRLADFAGLSGPSTDELADADIGRALAAASSALPADVISLRSVLDDAPGPVFISPVHHNEVGADIVAAAMFEHLAPKLRKLGAEP